MQFPGGRVEVIRSWESPSLQLRTGGETEVERDLPRASRKCGGGGLGHHGLPLGPLLPTRQTLSVPVRGSLPPSLFTRAAKPPASLCSALRALHGTFSTAE